MKNADDIRTEAIALLVEKLREIGAEADRETKRHREAEKSPAALADFRTFADHRETAALNYSLAYRCEQLCEEITGALLFDQLDADLPTEAFVDAADVEHYAQPGEYVNSAGPGMAPVEHFDAAEAADVLQIEHDLAVEAGMECAPETCAYCGGA